jgi:transposase-like protein
MVHWFRNVLTAIPTGKAREVVAMLKAIHAQQDRQAAEKKAVDVVAKLHELKLSKAAKIVEEGVAETLSYMAFPREHWTRIRTNNPLERFDEHQREEKFEIRAQQNEELTLTP